MVVAKFKSNPGPHTAEPSMSRNNTSEIVTHSVRFSDALKSVRSGKPIDWIESRTSRTGSKKSASKVEKAGAERTRR